MCLPHKAYAEPPSGVPASFFRQCGALHLMRAEYDLALRLNEDRGKQFGDEDEIECKDDCNRAFAMFLMTAILLHAGEAAKPSTAANDGTRRGFQRLIGRLAGPLECLRPPWRQPCRIRGPERGNAQG